MCGASWKALLQMLSPVLQVNATRCTKYSRHKFNFKQQFVATNNTGGDTRNNAFNLQCNVIAWQAEISKYLARLVLVEGTFSIIKSSVLYFPFSSIFFSGFNFITAMINHIFILFPFFKIQANCHVSRNDKLEAKANLNLPMVSSSLTIIQMLTLYEYSWTTYNSPPLLGGQ